MGVDISVVVLTRVDNPFVVVPNLSTTFVFDLDGASGNNHSPTAATATQVGTNADGGCGNDQGICAQKWEVSTQIDLTTECQLTGATLSIGQGMSANDHPYGEIRCKPPNDDSCPFAA